MKDKIIFNLKKPIKKSDKGQFIEVNILELHCPTRRMLEDLAPIRQELSNCILNIQSKESITKLVENNSAESNLDIDKEAIKHLLYMDRETNFKKIYSTFDLIAKNGAVKIDDKNINSVQLDELNFYDYESIIFEYIANFISPSVMKA